MEATRPAPLARAGGDLPAAQIAKAAFRRLAIERLEPTPENYERAWRHESGDTAPPGDALATLIDRIVRGVKRGGRLVPPGEFIPLAEDTGLIVPLSEWALREAARQAKVWQTNFDFDDSIAVNLPSHLFARSDLIEHIHQCVTSFGVPHRVIQLEITEDNLMKDLQNVIPALHRLNEIGVEISIDDFGTGYSSLAYLTTLPISELKIDRTFVRDLGITPQSSAVVTAIIALARSLGLRVIAEGVETLRQMEVLHRLGCGLMQGFLFSRPIAADDLEAWLQQTVLPRKAPWIGQASELDFGTDAARAAGGRLL